jgi:hypothetical protein
LSSLAPIKQRVGFVRRERGDFPVMLEGKLFAAPRTILVRTAYPCCVCTSLEIRSFPIIRIYEPLGLPPARKAVRQLAKDSAMEVPPDATIDAWLEAEVARRRRRWRWSALSIAWFLFKCAIAVPLAAFAIFNFWIVVLLLQQM